MGNTGANTRNVWGMQGLTQGRCGEYGGSYKEGVGVVIAPEGGETRITSLDVAEN